MTANTSCRSISLKLYSRMSRTVEEWIGKTPDSQPPPRVRLRVFDRYGGICHRSGIKIRPGDQWDLDHVVAIINGGENRESNLAPILKGKPHNEKSAEDVAEKSMVARKRKAHLGIKPKKRPFPGSKASGLKKRMDGRVEKR